MKTRSTWRSNTANINPYIYNQTGVTYNTIYPIYNGVVSQPVNTKKKATFTAIGKARSSWHRNRAGEAALHAYDRTAPYDSGTIGYDGLTTGQPVESDKKKTTWTPS